MEAKHQVVIGLLGSTLDSGKEPDRWERWRPTVSICQHENLLVSRLELLYEHKFLGLAEQVAGDVATCSPETNTRISMGLRAGVWLTARLCQGIRIQH